MSEKNVSSGERKRGKGQGLLEFALILPLLLLIIMAIIDFGYILLVYSNVFNASREGVRYGVTRPRDAGGIEDSARSRIAMIPQDEVVIDLFYDEGPGTTPTAVTTATIETVEIGDRILVDVQYTVVPITPLMQPILGNLDLHAQAARTIQNLGNTVSLPSPSGGGGGGGGEPTDTELTATAAAVETEAAMLTSVAQTSVAETAAAQTAAAGTPAGSVTPTSTPFPSATPTPTPLPIQINPQPIHGDNTVTGFAEPGKWVTMRDIQTGVQMDVQVDGSGNFTFNLLQNLVGGHTIVVQGYGQQDSAVVQGGTPTATPTNTPAPTPTPSTPFILVDPECGSVGEITVNVVGYNWPTSGPQLGQIGVYWDYGGTGEQKIAIPPGSSTFTATFTAQVERGTYTAFAQAEKSNGSASNNPDIAVTAEFESPCAAVFPNLQVTGLSLQEPLPTGTYEEAWLDVTVSNVGEIDVASLFWVDLYADATIPLDPQQASVDWVAINGLAAQSSITFTMYYLDGFDSTGDHNLVAMVDTWDQIVESDETDNLSAPLTLTLTTENPMPTPTPTPESPESPGAINGSVRISMDSGTIGQQGADVYVYDSDGRLVASTRSAENGSYSVANLAPGDYVVVGQIRLSGTLYRGQTVVTVPANTTVNAVDVYMIEMAGN